MLLARHPRRPLSPAAAIPGVRDGSRRARGGGGGVIVARFPRFLQLRKRLRDGRQYKSNRRRSFVKAGRRSRRVGARERLSHPAADYRRGEHARASERATETWGGGEGEGARAALEADGKVSAHLAYLAWESDISIADVVEAGTC